MLAILQTVPLGHAVLHHLQHPNNHYQCDITSTKPGIDLLILPTCSFKRVAVRLKGTGDLSLYCQRPLFSLGVPNTCRK